jgi:hypothetical protein
MIELNHTPKNIEMPKKVSLTTTSTTPQASSGFYNKMVFHK